MGLESGSQGVLDRCGKSSSVEEMIEAANKAAKAHIKSSVIVLLGLGGKKYSEEHVKGTVAALNRMQPRYLSFLSLMVILGTPLAEEVRRGEFEELNPTELLKESYEIIKGLELKKTVFRSDHASNYLALEGAFPKDKNDAVKYPGVRHWRRDKAKAGELKRLVVKNGPSRSKGHASPYQKITDVRTKRDGQIYFLTPQIVT